MQSEMEVTNPLSQSGATPRADAPVPLLALKRRRSTNTFHKMRRARLRTFLCRLDVCWTFFFFLFLVCVAVTTTAITQTYISRALLQRLHDTHNLHVYTLQKSLDLTTRRVFNMVVDLVTLHAQQPFVFGSQDTLSTLCSVLAQFDQSLYLRALTLNSLELKEAMACIHGDVSMPSPYQLYGWITENSVIPGVYLINNSTNHFDQPLQAVYGGWDASAYNQSGRFSAYIQDSTVFHDAKAYYNGTLQYIDYRNMWPQSLLLPHIIPVLVPVGFLFKGLNLPTNTNVTDYVGVRFNGAAVLDPAITALSPNITAAIFINASLTDDDPLIMSNNWGQASVNDTVILATDEYNVVKYLASSNVSDPLMRAALKHVNFAALQQEGHNETVDFQYRGAPATVTAATLTTSRGLVLPMVFASANADIATPYRRIMDICNGATAVAVVCFTALLGVLLHRYLHQPLQRMTDRMAEDARTGRYEPVREPALQLFRLSETHALLQAHRDTVQQLREIQRFIPRDVRLQMARGVRSTTSAATAGGADAAAPDEHVAAAAAAARGALVRQVSTLVQVLVRPCGCGGAGAAAGGAAAAALVAPQQQQPQPGTRHRLAAVVEQAARAAELVNSGPFPTPAALGGFVAALQELCEEHGGTLHRLAPDGCALHFGRAVRARVAGGGAADDAAALEVCAALDARAAMRFAFALLRWVDRCGVAGMPDVRVLVDSSPFVCGRHRPRGSEQTLSVALGRDVKRVLGTVPASIGVRVAMTEETAVLVRAGNVAGGPAGGVRQIPVDAFRVGRAVLDGDVVILFEALPGAAADDDAWRTYFHTCCTAFSALVRGQYAAALGIYKQVADIADLEPGLVPSSMRREAAASRAVGGAVSVQVQRLMRECVGRVARGDTRALCRTPIDRLGIDTVLAAVTPAGVPPEAMWSRNGGQSRGGAGVSLPAAASTTGVELDALGPKSAERFVVDLRDSSTIIRTVLGSPLDWVVDNNGLRWTIAKRKLTYTANGMWAARFPCLGSAGTVANVNFIAFREVPRPVANAVRNAPLGPMSDALRSATPVFVITPQLKAALQKLYLKQFKIRHPNLLVPLGYSTSWEGGVVMIWEHNAGGTLREVRARYYRIKLVTAARFLYGIISGVAYLHSEGLVHAALNLDNIFVGADGICRLRGHLLDQEKVLLKLVLPRFCYVSPAMAAGALPTPACDMFCYGLLCIELLSGAKAWRWAVSDQGEPGGTDDELATLMAAAEQPFFDAVVAGRIVANIEVLDAVVPVNESEYRFINVARTCLQSDPALRPLSGAVALGIEEVLAFGADSGSSPT